jgi:hypothetical protein
MVEYSEGQKQYFIVWWVSETDERSQGHSDLTWLTDWAKKNKNIDYHHLVEREYVRKNHETEINQFEWVDTAMKFEWVDGQYRKMR